MFRAQSLVLRPTGVTRQPCRHVFRAAWVRACTDAGVEPVRVEWLRHTGASIAYRETKDMKAVANRLGHTSVRMLDTVYLSVYADASRIVANALDDLGADSMRIPGRR